MNIRRLDEGSNPSDSTPRVSTPKSVCFSFFIFPKPLPVLKTRVATLFTSRVRTIFFSKYISAGKIEPNDPKNGEIYGKLYNWYAVNDLRGLAPEGWFIPTDSEWNELFEFLGGEYSAFEKLTAENEWEYHLDSTNESGFTALPGGGRDENGVFYFWDYGYIAEIEDDYAVSWNQIGYDSYWWSSSIDKNSDVRRFEISQVCRGIYKTDKGKGCYVRCVNHNFRKTNFKKIGNQKWMPENLNVERFRNGDQIREARTNEEWELAGMRKLPVWCYPNNDSSCDKLYNWYAVKDRRGLAPLGVKIPNNSDWLTLVEFLGGKEIAGGKMQRIGYNPEIDDYEINDCGFNASSPYTRGEFGHFNSSGYIVFWSSTEKSIQEAGYISVQEDDSIVNLGNTNKGVGYFVRCLKD
ncbi:MAG: fibrobacter succinogenes major paralogous domain-containing protein [Bacteroidetes bacterium]|nr:fibrobacter succinogenes major paralogous domain-containing protein [Bacteroidota bacterium]